MKTLKHHVVTSWSVSYFWVIFSLIVATLSTYSFVQVDWVIKKDVIVTSYYPFVNGTLIHSVSQATNYYRGYESVQLLHNTSTIYSESFNETSSDLSITNTTQMQTYPDFLLSYADQLRDPQRKEIKKPMTIVSFGSIGFCTYNNRSSKCELYDEKLHAVSVIWPMLTFVGGSGCMVLCVSAVMSLLAVALPTSSLRYQVARNVGQAQAVSVVLLFLSLLGFPFGFGSDFVRLHCGSAVGAYNIGDCEIGWAYALVIVCASLALYCPVLVHFTMDTKYEYLPKHL